MSSQDSTDPLIQLFSSVLRVECSSLSDQSAPRNTPQWDSIKAMELVASIEETFEVRLSTREIMKMRSIGIARGVLRDKGVAGV